MNIATTGLGMWGIVALMALVTLATRWGGVFLMTLVPISPRVKQFIRAMSSSVLVALLAPLAVNGDHGTRVGLATTAVLMLVLKRPLPSIATGIVAVALARHF